MKTQWWRKGQGEGWRGREGQAGTGWGWERGPVVLRAAPALEVKLRPREGGGTGRETSALTQPRCVERAGVWPTGQASGSIMGWRGLRRQGEYYGLEQP